MYTQLAFASKTTTSVWYVISLTCNVMVKLMHVCFRSKTAANGTLLEEK